MTRLSTPIWTVTTVTAAVSGLAVAAHLIFLGPSLWIGITVVGAVMLPGLCFTLAHRHRQGPAEKSTRGLLRDPRIRQLALAEAHLVSLRAAYSENRFSGHPEEMLWSIEDARIRVKKLRCGTD